MSRKPPILCIDFDGVLHSYESGWKGPRNIPDEPVIGAIHWLRSLLSDPESTCCMAPRYLEFDVQIFSSRSRYWGAKGAMKRWLMKWFQVYGYPADLVELLKFPTEKPPASIFIDDRAFRFEGSFPETSQMMKMLEPWNKKNEGHQPAELIILVGNIGCGKSRNTMQWARQQTDNGWVVVNMDSIQQMIGAGDYNLYDNEKKPIYRAVEEKTITEALERGFSVVVDRTNMDRKRRKRVIDIGKRYHWVKIRCIDWGPGTNGNLQTRLDEARGIPSERWVEVFKYMQESYNKPEEEEGFDFIVNMND